MFCNNCGAKASDNALFCGECGSPIKRAPIADITEAIEAPEVTEAISVPEPTETIEAIEAPGTPEATRAGAPETPKAVDKTEAVESTGETKAVEITEAIEAAEVPGAAEAINTQQNMFCNNCGAKVSINGLFCGECGTPIYKAANTGAAETIKIQPVQRLYNEMPMDNQEEAAPKGKENLLPLIITLIAVIAVSGASIWYMLNRASKPISIELPNIEEIKSDGDEEKYDDGEKVNSKRENGVNSQKSKEVPAIREEATDMVAPTTEAPSEAPAVREEDRVLGEPEDQYFFPSDREYITEAYLATLPKDRIAFVRNEIYARHGFIFQTEPYKSYFSGKSWYMPNEEFSDTLLSEIEKTNVDFITAYEEKMGWR